MTNIKLPSLDMFSRVFIRNYNNEFGDLAAHHPVFKLGHNLLDIGFDLVVLGYQHCKAIFLNSRNFSVSLELVLFGDAIKGPRTG